MARNIANGIQNKRLSELRKENVPTVVLSHQLSVLQKYQSSEVLLFDGVGRKSNESTLREHHAYLKQDSTVSQITSKGFISKIPLIPTVTFYIIVIIIIGMTLAFHQKKSFLQDQEINIEEIYKLLKRTIDRGKECSEDVFLFPSKQEMEQSGWRVDVGVDIFSMDEKELSNNGIDDIDGIYQIKESCKMDSWFGFDNMMGNANVTKIFDYNGEATLTFGNCGDIFQTGSVTVTRISNGTNYEIGKALQGEYNLTKVFSVDINDEIFIEEHGYGIIKLISFDVKCGSRN